MVTAPIKLGIFGIGGMKMESNGRKDWRVRVCRAVGILVGIAVARYVIFPLVDLPSWLGMIVYVAMVLVGMLLGQFVGSLVFRRT